jgi:hypothetical protein
MDLANRVRELGYRIADLLDRVLAIAARVTTAEADIVTLDGRLDTAESDIGALETADTALDGRLDTIEAGYARGEVAYASITSNPAGGIGSTFSDISGLSVTFTPTVGRLYVVRAALRVGQATSQGVQEVAVRNGSDTVLNNSTMTVDTNEIGYHVVHYRWEESSGSSLTLKVSASTTAGTCDPFHQGTQPADIQVLDVGPA